jgi:hypothetical protein
MVLRKIMVAGQQPAGPPCGADTKFRRALAVSVRSSNEVTMEVRIRLAMFDSRRRPSDVPDEKPLTGLFGDEEDVETSGRM